MKTHRVKTGESLPLIAQRYGFNLWETIYNAPENAELKEKRPNPYVLYAGDEVIIPDKEIGEESVPTDQRHKFKVLGKRSIFRLVLRDDDGDPIADEPWVLHIREFYDQNGTTATNGLIEAKVPDNATKGILETLGDEFILQFGQLNPVTRITGIQQRLNNLGYAAGAVDGDVGKKTRKALLAFQAKEDLETTGEPDEDTRKKLLELHDNDQRFTEIEDGDEVMDDTPDSDVPNDDNDELGDDEIDDPNDDWEDEDEYAENVPVDEGEDSTDWFPGEGEDDAEN